MFAKIVLNQITTQPIKGMSKRQLHEIFVTLTVSKISFALSALGWLNFLTGQQMNRINVFLVKYDVLVFVPLHEFVMYRNILASLIVNCSRVYKACITYFRLRTSVVCVLEDMVIPICQYSPVLLQLTVTEIQNN